MDLLLYLIVTDYVGIIGNVSAPSSLMLLILKLINCSKAVKQNICILGCFLLLPNNFINIILINAFRFCYWYCYFNKVKQKIKQKI